MEGDMPTLRWNVIDWCVAISLTAFAEVQLVVFSGCCGQSRVSWAAYLLTAAETLPVAWRRRFPLPLLFVTSGAAALQVVLGTPVSDFGQLGVLALFYTVASQSRQGVAIAIAVLTGAGILAAGAIDRWTAPYQLVLVYVEFAAAGALGAAARRWRRQVAARAAQLERDREERAREAAARERARIARELHDVVMHSLSIITLQAGAARSVVEMRPDRVTPCLREIENVSREAWAEMRLFLDLADRNDGAWAPEPLRTGLAQLENLVERFEQAGLSIDLAITGKVRPLPAEVDDCAYRVVRESLTNTLRHAADSHAQVTIGYDDGSVRLEIANSGGVPPEAPSSGTHHGMAGMQTRVKLVGGELSVDDRADAFTVSARLPVPTTR
jgi:signal transduction histidine kinase